jgi:hypothetical protein
LVDVLSICVNSKIHKRGGFETVEMQFHQKAQSHENIPLFHRDSNWGSSEREAEALPK